MEYDKFAGMKASVEVPQRTTLAMLVGRLEELSKVLHQTESEGVEMADRLGGAQPRPVSTGDNAKSPSDLLSQLHSLAAECTVTARSVASEISRARVAIG